MKIQYTNRIVWHNVTILVKVNVLSALAILDTSDMALTLKVGQVIALPHGSLVC